MSTTHTPGPWSIERCAGGSYIVAANPANPEQAREKPAQIQLLSISDDEGGGCGQANARLIAAAPDLLAAAKKARDELAAHLDYESDPGMDKALEMLEDAIGKTLGAA